MPGVSVHSAQKNMSKSKRASQRKNTNRVEAAIRGDIEDCTYGRIHKALGNKMFIVINSSKKERLAHIRGKMARIGVDDVVLLNVREYETRSGTDSEVYDIMAVFDKKSASKLVKDRVIPSWLTLSSAAEEGEEDIFDHSEDADEDLDADPSKPTKRKEIDLDNEEFNINYI
jgi:translation initiation factor IF-1